MTEKGWIKLHRKLLDSWLWDIKPFDKARAWVDLLLLAMHHDKKIVIDDKPTIIKRGSYFTSRGQLADRWGWSVKKVDAFLKTIEAEGMIVTVRTPKGTLITIVNYDQYQMENNESSLQETSERLMECEKNKATKKKTKTKQTKFNNFEHRKYDMDSLEAQLLGAGKKGEDNE